MSYFTVKIDTDNEAFAYEDGRDEIARILEVIVKRLRTGDDFSKAQTLRDINGNDVGRAKYFIG